MKFSFVARSVLHRNAKNQCATVDQSVAKTGSTEAKTSEDELPPEPVLAGGSLDKSAGPAGPWAASTSFLSRRVVGQPAIVKYGLALVTVGVATLLSLAVDPYVGGRYYYISYLIAVLAAALYAGSGPALLAAGVGHTLGNLLFNEPRGLFSYAIGDLIGLAVYAVAAVAIIVLAEGKRRALERSTALMEQALVQKRELEQEITQRRIAEERLRSLHTLVDGITRGTEDLIVAEDSDFRYLYFNDAYRREFRRLWAQDLEVGASMAQMLAPWPEEQRKAMELWSRALNGESFSITTEFGPSHQEKQVYDLHFSPVKDSGGRQIGAAHIMRNVTERVRTQQALRRSEAMLSAVLEALPVGVGVVDTEGRVLSLNPAGLRIHGFPSTNEMCSDLQQNFGKFELRYPDGRLMPQQAWPIARALRGERVHDYEVCLRRRPIGEEAILSYEVLPVAGGPDTAGYYIVVVRDITARKRAEEALKEADRRKDEFLATLAHELRNPLAPIRNAAEILKLQGREDPVLRAAREMIDRQVRHMVRLIDELLDLSRISQGKIRLQRERLPIGVIVQQALESGRPAIQQAGLELHVSLPPDPIYVDADPTRLAQVFANLLNNAAKFTDVGGHVWFTVEREDDHVVARVRDTGIGIAADMLPEVFKMFTQLERSANRSQGGLGIGLSLVKQLVELHGGSVEAHSNGRGAGSEFVVRLPAVEPQPATEVPMAIGQERPTASGRILVVDDNVDSAQSLSTLLGVMGYETLTAYDGLEAMAAAEQFRPDIALLDIGMPRLDGLEACRRIRAQPWGKNMLIVALTGWGQQADRQKSSEAAFDYHLVKPVDPAELTTLLASRQRSMQSEDQAGCPAARR